MATYPNKEFQDIYDGIIASMGTDDQLKANLEAALRPLYEQSLEQLQQRRRENNAAIDVDAASRGMGNSTWVTDAKLRQLKDIEGNIATLDANYNNQLFGQLQDAIKDRDANAYNQAMQWWNIGQKGKGGSSTPPKEDDDLLTFEEYTALPENIRGLFDNGVLSTRADRDKAYVITDKSAKNAGNLAGSLIGKSLGNSLGRIPTLGGKK